MQFPKESWMHSRGHWANTIPELSQSGLKVLIAVRSIRSAQPGLPSAAFVNVMSGIENILIAGKKTASMYGGVNKFAEHLADINVPQDIADLTNHTNDTVSTKATRILAVCFSDSGNL